MVEGGDNKSYINLIVFLMMAFVSFIIASTSGYFAYAGLYYGESIFEQDVLDDKYKYECLTNCGTATATYNTSDTLVTYENNYEGGRDIINSNVLLFLGAFSIIFSLLTLVFLFIALREAGLFKRKESSTKDVY